MGNVQLFCNPGDDESKKGNSFDSSNYMEPPKAGPVFPPSEETSTVPPVLEPLDTRSNKVPPVVEPLDTRSNKVPTPVEEEALPEESINVPNSLASSGQVVTSFRRTFSWGLSDINSIFEGTSEAVVTGIALLIAVSAALVMRWAGQHEGIVPEAMRWGEEQEDVAEDFPTVLDASILDGAGE